MALDSYPRSLPIFASYTKFFMNNNIIIKRAHTNNLCDIDLEIPKNSIVVFSASASAASQVLAVV